MKTALKNISLLLLITLLVAASACKKGSTTVSCKPTKIQNTGIDTTYITYNAEGKVATLNHHAWGNYTFTYSGLSANAAIQYYDTSYHFTNTIVLNAAGNMVFMTKTQTRLGTTTNYTYSFQYDADGHVIWCEAIRQNVGGDPVCYKDSLIYFGGNLIETYTFEKVGGATNYSPYKHATTEYGTVPNKAGYNIWYGSEAPMGTIQEYIPYSHLMGNTSKNLPTGSRVYDSAGTLNFQLAYTFLLDENGYPTEESMVRSISGPSSKNRKFEYSCD